MSCNRRARCSRGDHPIGSAAFTRLKIFSTAPADMARGNTTLTRRAVVAATILLASSTVLTSPIAY